MYRKRKHSEDDYKQYKIAEKAFRKACAKAKTDDWRYFTETQKSFDSINKPRKILESNTKHTLGVLSKPDGTVTEPGVQTLDYLLKAITSQQNNQPGQLNIPKLKSPQPLYQNSNPIG